MNTRIRTLVADDEPIARARMLALLSDEPDIEVIGECADGPQAMAAIERTSPDLVFLDIQMPQMDGLTLARTLGRTMPAVVFITAYEQLDRCRDPANFVGWFFLILRNRCLAEQRAARRAVPIDESVAQQVAPQRPDRGIEIEEVRRALELAIAGLTAEQREVFVLRHIEGWSYDAIAQHTGVSVDALKMRMHRSFDRLRESLSAFWDGSL